MMLIKLIILVAINYCCCCDSLISCANEDNHESEVGSSASGNANSHSGDSQHAELEKLGKLLFMSPDDFNRERPRLLETIEVRPLLDRFADLQVRSLGTQIMDPGQAQNRWTSSASRFLVDALREFSSLAREENEGKMVKNCASIVTMENVKGTRSLVAETIPILSKFADENYQRIIEKCMDFLKSRFKSFSSMLSKKEISDGRNFAKMITSSMNKLKLFGSEDDEEVKQMALTEATARFVEKFGGPGLTRRCDEANQLIFKKYFMKKTGILINPLCEEIQKIPLNIVFETVNVLLVVEPDQLKSLNGYDRYEDLMWVATVCQYWPRTISRSRTYNAHSSFHMDLNFMNPLKKLHDAVFSTSARRIKDVNEIEWRMRDLRDELATRAVYENDMLKLDVRELNFLLGIKNRKSQDSKQQIEQLIEYYNSIGAHNIVIYLNSFINEQLADTLAEIETIVRAGIEHLADLPQINANLRELRRFVPGSYNIMAELTTNDLLTGLTDYFLYNLQNFQQISEVEDYQSRKDLVTRWFNQFMDDNCEKYKQSFDGTLLAQRNLRPEKALSGLDDELKLVLFNVILCNNMDNNILNHIDELTGLISSRLDGGGPSDQIDEMTQIGL